MRRFSLFLMAAVLPIATAGLAVVAGSLPPTNPGAPGLSRTARVKPAEGTPPIWAAQLNWLPIGGTGLLHIQYDSTLATLAGAYKSTTAVFSAGKDIWHTYTWKLAQVDFAGRQNAGADLRLSGPPGVAVHQVTLSLRPPGTSGHGPHGANGPTTSIIFDTGKTGTIAANTDHDMKQVAAGGNTIDSKYTCGLIAGRSAEIFANKMATSYIYLRLSRRSKLFLAHPTVVYATVTYAVTRPPVAWSERTFAHLVARGIRYAEINMEWAAVEPRPGRFDFQMLDQTLANAAKAHVRIIPLFWNAVWTGNPPSWITHYDVGSSGAPSRVPTWWNRFNRRSYFHYVTATIAHIKNNPGFGGAFLDFGWLDYMWGPPPGGKDVNGYAPADVARFHRWLPARYHSLRAFNRRYGVHYTSWDAIPAAAPGQQLFHIYQHFRNWSVIETYGRLTALVRRETAAPLYYYWGGGYGGAGVAFNLPDSFFQLARRYHVTVCLDDADHTGLGLLFGSLARAYGVRLFQEWTPRPSGLHAEIAEFLGHYGFAAPREVGMDFFLYHGGKEYAVGYPQYVRWIPLLSRIHGSYPLQPVAIYVTYRPVFTHPAALAGMADRLAGIWRKLPLAFTVVTNREVAAGVVRLGQFRAIFPLNGRHDRAITNYAAHGGHVLDHASQLAQYAPAYLTFAPSSDRVEALPTVHRAAHSAWITLSGWRPAHPYSGVATIHLGGLGLPRGRYHIMNAATGRPIASFATRGELQVPLHIAPGDLLLWRILPGPGAALRQPPPIR